MRIGLEHIDPKIATAMRERLCAPGTLFLKDDIRWADAEETSLIRLFLNQALRRPERRPPEEAERLAYGVHRQRERMMVQRAGITLSASLAAAGLTGTFFSQLVAGNFWIAATVGLITGIAGLVVGGLWTWHATSAHELYYELTFTEFQAVIPLLTLTEVEAAYCDLLMRVGDNDPNQEARRAVRRHIVKMKEFVTLGRQLESMDETAAQREQAALHTRIGSAYEDLVQAVNAIADALCTILVVPSPAGDRASERIDTELQTYRRIVQEIGTEVLLAPTLDRKRSREKAPQQK